MRSRVYETVERPSVRPSVCPVDRQPRVGDAGCRRHFCGNLLVFACSWFPRKYNVARLTMTAVDAWQYCVDEKLPR